MADNIDTSIDLNTGSSSTSSLTFPTNYVNEAGQFISFQRYKFSKASITTPATAQKAANSSMVVLPIPPQLVSSYGVDWQNANLGMTKNQLLWGARTAYETFAAGQGSVSDALNLGAQAVSSAPLYLLKGA